MTTETPRVALYQRLTEVLGPDHASTLMTYLPTGEPATKTDVQELRSAIRDLRSEILGSRSELKSDLREMEQRLDLRLDRVEVRLNTHEQRFDNVHEAMRQQTRTFVLATTGSMVTLSAVAFGAAALI